MASPSFRAEFRPALLAAYRDLPRLRYDYPVVLLSGDAGGEYVKSLSSVMGGLITDIAPRGIEGERLRKQLLRLEREIRGLVAGGTTGLLTDLWPLAADKAAGRDDNVREILRRAVESLDIDGEVLDCDKALTARFLRRAWQNVHAEKSAHFRVMVDHLVRKLSDILRAAFVHSQAGQQPEALKSGFGALHDDVFDFSAMSRLVARNVPKDELPASRRQRIEWALSVLRSQPFYPDPRGARNGSGLRVHLQRLCDGDRGASHAPAEAGRGREGDRGGGTRGTRRLCRGRSRRLLRAL